MLSTETKVKAAGIATYLACAVGLALLNAVSSDANLIEGLPDWAEAVILPLIPALAAWLSGYQSRNRSASLAPSTVLAARSRIGVDGVKISD